MCHSVLLEHAHAVAVDDPYLGGTGEDGGILVACCHAATTAKAAGCAKRSGCGWSALPRPFSLHTSRHLMRLLGRSDEKWRKYLFF